MLNLQHRAYSEECYGDTGAVVPVRWWIRCQNRANRAERRGTKRGTACLTESLAGPPRRAVREGRLRVSLSRRLRHWRDSAGRQLEDDGELDAC